MSLSKSKTSSLFVKSFKDYKNNKLVVDKFKDFTKFKLEHPAEPFGGKDYPFVKNGVLGGYWHAGLTRDISIFYKIENDILYLCGIFSHQDAGIGTPGNINKQRSLASKLSNQVFELKQGQ